VLKKAKRMLWKVLFHENIRLMAILIFWQDTK